MLRKARRNIPQNRVLLYVEYRARQRRFPCGQNTRSGGGQGRLVRRAGRGSHSGHAPEHRGFFLGAKGACDLIPSNTHGGCERGYQRVIGWITARTLGVHHATRDKTRAWVTSAGSRCDDQASKQSGGFGPGSWVVGCASLVKRRGSSARHGAPWWPRWRSGRRAGGQAP